MGRRCRGTSGHWLLLYLLLAQAAKVGGVAGPGPTWRKVTTSVGPRAGSLATRGRALASGTSGVGHASGTQAGRPPRTRRLGPLTGSGRCSDSERCSMCKPSPENHSSQACLEENSRFSRFAAASHGRDLGSRHGFGRRNRKPVPRPGPDSGRIVDSSGIGPETGVPSASPGPFPCH